jgi:hypothetical protein
MAEFQQVGAVQLIDIDVVVVAVTTKFVIAPGKIATDLDGAT